MSLEALLCGTCADKGEPVTRRRGQLRRVTIRSVHIDLPPDLSCAITHVADKAGISAEALIIDLLRDIFPSAIMREGTLALLAQDEPGAN